jgi:phospholipase/carboxylesterase
MQHKREIHHAGVSLQEANKVLIMLHGRGGSAPDILSLRQHLNVNDYCLLAPQATNNTWYPNGFMAPRHANEPWLSSAVQMVDDVVKDVLSAGISSENIYILGFSQGACLTLEYATRQAHHWGGVVSFTGGLIGETLDRSLYTGDLSGTRVFIGNSDIDPHVPQQRSEESKEIMEGLGAEVTLKIYPGMPHTISQDELDWVNTNIFK